MAGEDELPSERFRNETRKNYIRCGTIKTMKAKYINDWFWLKKWWDRVFNEIFIQFFFFFSHIFRRPSLVPKFNLLKNVICFIFISLFPYLYFPKHRRHPAPTKPPKKYPKLWNISSSSSLIVLFFCCPVRLWSISFLIELCSQRNDSEATKWNWTLENCPI